MILPRTFSLLLAAATALSGPLRSLAQESLPVVSPLGFGFEPDDLYHCEDPLDQGNKLACDPETSRWKLEELDPSASPDDSGLCRELVAILALSRQKHQEQQQQQNQNGQLPSGHSDIGTWEATMSGTAVDSLEPCILWAMTYGPLMSVSNSNRGEGVSVEESAADQQGRVEVNQKPKADEKEPDSPETTEFFVDFDPILMALVWDRGISHPLSFDRPELHELTGRHLLDSLRAEIGHDTVQKLELRVAEGTPDYASGSLSMTLTGRVVFSDPKQALGPGTLSKVMLQSAFVDTDAMDLYLLRLRIASDATLNEVDAVVAGKKAVTGFLLQHASQNQYDNSNSNSNNYNNNNIGSNNNNQDASSIIDVSDLNLNDSDEGLVSNLLIAILSAVGAAILSVLCFAYCLLCRSLTSKKASKTLEEHSLVDDEEMGKPYRDGVPAVKTAPTGDDDDHDDGNGGYGNESHYDLEYVTGSQVDDGVSEYEMETLPPPSTTTHTDDEGSLRMRMAVMADAYDNDDEEILPSAGEEEEEDYGENVGGGDDDDDDARSAISDAGTSLYSYIPDDTSVSASLVQATGPFRTTPTHSNRTGQQQQSQIDRPETTLEKTQRKSILWSVMDSLKKAPHDNTSDSEKVDMYVENSNSNGSIHSGTRSRKNSLTNPTGMLGPTSDNDSQSRDSNSLLYGTDDEDNAGYGASKPKMTHRLKENPYAYPEDSKERFEELWKSEDRVHGETDDNESYNDDEDNNDDDGNYDAEENYKQTIHPDHNSSFDEAESVLGFITSERAARRSRQSASPEPEDMVDWVPESSEIAPASSRGDTAGEEDGNDDDVNEEDGDDDQRVLPLPSALAAVSMEDGNSVASSVSNTSKNLRGASARTKKSVWSSGSSVGSGMSVGSTDSSKLRSLLGQSDTNDAALVFGKKQQQQQQASRGQTKPKDDSSSSSGSSSTPEAEVSMSSCTSGQLKSLLTHNGDEKDTSYEEEGLLFSEKEPSASTANKTATAKTIATATPTRRLEEEKKDDADDDDDRDASKMYLPASIRPKAPSAASTPTRRRKRTHDNDDSTVFSAFSEAPSVDASINSGMGWF